ncbi:flagellar basal-body rod protein FlgG [Clostridium acetobutylicum]|uniref:Flagellar basal body rod protein n=1 Tax=Clostridium acetobutylicum (strain ATCC 824 / DSM 792 / JCM 1419 / IAM 19013 / LMG 5710 / NBRC 13948 / NRRL B-527 / VKM B-1787 / 2291 / W) TaxID=272562 RepID=Q97H74_CLOAB|nr:MULTISPECIES: flagellar basal-body rod protein FlgG [Clostridium]AAK80097.1 Flagellar basal body rod protein [Clostridium acetobutylicum ATCC 824]ADZ21190.1 flagellar basal body rod protein FlgG [Clostridium acetobutylicum EA 2018]AEI34492.1 flagellar basal body rod protein FlgG [Clostridium acetobutylicum DSM 1731]AWV79477.1 flagellar hook-basal body complex protein [Clostridium acetobutylicum]MBC2394551.1 flagellar basal body rod protein FlgG [Clostridium acetobutylicum]
MLRIMWNGVSGMAAEQEKLDSISNNLANSSTTGYKSETVGFSDLLYETLNRKGYPVTNDDNNRYTGSGVKANEWIRNNAQGSLTPSDSKTALAIDGSGYFKVTTPDGTEAYERAGSFTVNANGRIVDPNGNYLNIDYSVDPSTVKFTASNVAVAQDGTISIQNGQTTTNVGKINIYDVTGNDSMISVGKSLFVPKAGAQMFVNNKSVIYQNYLENSNVDLGTEMTDMIVAQRAYQINSKSLETGDNMWSIVNNMKK